MTSAPPAPPAEAPPRLSDIGLLLGMLQFDLVRLGVALRALVAEHRRPAQDPHEEQARTMAVLYLNTEAANALAKVEESFARIRPLAGPAEKILQHWERELARNQDSNTATHTPMRSTDKPN